MLTEPSQATDPISWPANLPLAGRYAMMGNLSAVAAAAIVFAAAIDTDFPLFMALTLSTGLTATYAYDATGRGFGPWRPR
jgi:hypothetical protein